MRLGVAVGRDPLCSAIGALRRRPAALAAALVYVLPMWALRGGVVVAPREAAGRVPAGIAVAGWTVEPYWGYALTDRVLLVFPAFTLAMLALTGLALAAAVAAWREARCCAPAPGRPGAAGAALTAAVLASAASCCFPVPALGSALLPLLLPLLGVTGRPEVLAAWADGASFAALVAAACAGAAAGPAPAAGRALLPLVGATALAWAGLRWAAVALPPATAWARAAAAFAPWAGAVALTLAAAVVASERRRAARP